MSDLPESWLEIEITAVLQLNDNGKPFQQGWSPRCDSHPAPIDKWGVVKTTAVQDGEFWEHENKRLSEHLEPKPNIEIRSGDILMTCAGPRSRCGVVCAVESTRPKLMMSGKMYRFRPDLDVMNTDYLTYYIRTYAAQIAIDGMKTGISDSGLNLTHDRFAQLRIPVAPRNEQNRIVAKLETLLSEIDKGVEDFSTALDQLKIYRLAILKCAFEGKLSANWRNEYDATTKSVGDLLQRVDFNRNQRYEASLEQWEKLFAEWQTKGCRGKKPSKPRKQTAIEPSEDEFDSLSALPAGWSWALLGQVADHIVDGTHKTPKYVQKGVHFISAKDINDFKISFDHTRYISKQEHAELTYRCRPEIGNVLVTKSGTIGRVAIVDTDREFSLFESVANIPVLRPVDSVYAAYAIYYAIASGYGARHQKGVAVRHLHLEDLRRLPIPLPPPREQEQIASRVVSMFSELDNQEAQIGIELQRTTALRQSVLRKAFSGKLVQQEPSEEPASALLERTKAQKEAGAKEEAPKRRTKKTNKKSKRRKDAA